MDQNITLSIAGKLYPLKASSPGTEEVMRLAAESINAMLDKYNAKFPDRNPDEKMAFVALQQTVSRISAERKLVALNAKLDSLEKELGDYLAEFEE